jgi:hypothetical protein
VLESKDNASKNVSNVEGQVVAAGQLKIDRNSHASAKTRQARFNPVLRRSRHKEYYCVAITMISC